MAGFAFDFDAFDFDAFDFDAFGQLLLRLLPQKTGFVVSMNSTLWTGPIGNSETRRSMF